MAMTAQLIIGVDPGVTTGIFAVTFLASGALKRPPVALQVHHANAVETVHELLQSIDYLTEPLLAIEGFVVSGRASRSSSAHAAKITQELIGQLMARHVRTVIRPAATVKPWATDKRLEAAGLLAATEGMRHARDAARHALYAAVHQGVARDPLSQLAARE